MTHHIWAALLLAAVFAHSANAQKPAATGKPDLSGKWQLDGKPAETVSIQQTVDTISVVALNTSTGDKAQTEIQCSIKGKECSARVEGRDAKVTFFFNGTTLVQFTDAGGEVSKTQRSLSEDGQRITVEHVGLNPPGKPESHVLVRSAGGELQSSAKPQP